MKKSIFALAAAVLMLGMTACQKDEIIDNGNVVTPGNASNPRVKSAADLIGTEWEYTLDLSAGMDSADIAFLYECMDSADVAALLSMTFGLNFDSTYAHLTFPEDVTGLNVVENGEDYTVEEIQEMAYTYTYNGTTQTGTLSGGNFGDLVIPFTYDTTNDQITIDMMVAEEGNEANATPWTLVFSRVI